MKRFFLVLIGLFFSFGAVFADTVYNNDKEIKCTVEGVSGGLIHVLSSGNMMSFRRVKQSPVFKDSVEVRKFLFSTQLIKYTGKIEYADNMKIKIIQDGVLVTVPRYKVVNISIFII